MAFRNRGGGRRQRGGDVFRRSLDERRKVEDEVPWFLADDDGPVDPLDIEAGRSARMGEAFADPDDAADPPAG